jgi:hypothetical protein
MANSTLGRGGIESRLLEDLKTFVKSKNDNSLNPETVAECEGILGFLRDFDLPEQDEAHVACLTVRKALMVDLSSDIGLVKTSRFTDDQLRLLSYTFFGADSNENVPFRVRQRQCQDLLEQWDFAAVNFHHQVRSEKYARVTQDRLVALGNIRHKDEKLAQSALGRLIRESQDEVRQERLLAANPPAECEVAGQLLKSSPKMAQISIRYRVQANSENLGPVRLFIDYNVEATADGDVLSGLRLSLRAGSRELAVHELELQLKGDPAGLRVKHFEWRSHEEDPRQNLRIHDAEQALRRHGLVVANVGRETVVDGVLYLHLVIAAIAVKVNTFVRVAQADPKADWNLHIDAGPEDLLQILIRAENLSVETMVDMVIAANLPSYVTYVQSSTIILNANHPNGIDAGSDNIARGGINVGAYAPKTVSFALFTVKLDRHVQFGRFGNYRLTFVGVARPFGFNETYNTTSIGVHIENLGQN